MLKTLFFISLLSFMSLASAKVEVRWLTVSCIVLQDGESTLVFDPMFTRAGLSHWLNLSELRSDQVLVEKVLKEQGITKADAVFASHSHFDHSIDAPMVSKISGATFYTDRSSERIARAYRDPQIKTKLLTNRQPIQIGKFKLTPILRDHAPIRLIDVNFLPGDVPETFRFGFYDYHMGETWFYFIEHPELKILIDQGASAHLDKLKSLTSSVDVLIQGIANREHDEAITKGYLLNLKPKLFIPTHIDNFFAAFNPQAEMTYLPGVKWDEFLKSFEQTKPSAKLIKPKYGERIVLTP
jgi:L-ascorbate metabolism protein UlaG (beta-lactamase superfamily)